MAKIKYTDLVESGAIDQLISDLKDLKKQAQDNPLGDGKDVKEFNEQLAKTVKITDDLVEVQKEENKVLQAQSNELKDVNQQLKDQDDQLGDVQEQQKKAGDSTEGLGKRFTAMGVAAAAALFALGAQVAQFAKEALMANQTVADGVKKVQNTIKISTSLLVAESVKSFKLLNISFNGFIKGLLSAIPGGQGLIPLILGSAAVSESFNKLENERVKLQAKALKKGAELGKQIEQAKLDSEDTTKSLEARVDFATEAFNLEAKVADLREQEAAKALEAAKLAFNIEGSNENTLALAQAQANVDDISTAKLTRQIELQNKINTIKTQQISLEQAARQEQLQHELQLSLIQGGQFTDPIQRAEAELAAWSRYYSGVVSGLKDLRSETDEGSVAWLQYTNAMAIAQDGFTEIQLGIQSTIELQKVSTAVWQESAIGIVGSLSQVGQALSKSARQQQIIAAAAGAINAALAVTQVFADPKTTNIYEKIVAVLAAIAVGIGLVTTIKNVPVPSYASGTERLRGGNDGILIRAHRDERITPAHINNQLMGVSNDALPGLVHMGMAYQDGMLGLAVRHLKATENTNQLLGKWEYEDGSGAQVNLAGNKKTHYVN